MPKIVIQSSPWIQFDDTNPIEIIDHSNDRETGVLYFTYRIKFSISGNEFYQNSVFVALADQTPFRTSPTMFKNQNVKTAAQALDNIKNFDVKRAQRFQQGLQYFAFKDISSKDVRNGYVDIVIEDRKSNNSKKTFLYFFARSANNERVISTTIFSILDLIKRYEMPFSDFFVNSSKVKFNKRRIGISSADSRIKKFAIYAVNKYGAYQNQKDSAIEPIYITINNGSAFIDIDEVDSVARTYRVTPVSFYTNTPCAVYKEINVNPERLVNSNCIIYATEINTQRITLTVKSIPKRCINVKLLRRNLTQRELTYDYVPVNITSSLTSNLIHSSTANTRNTVTFSDVTIVPYNAYDYKVEFEYANGDRKISESNCSIFPQILNDVVSLTVELLTEAIVENKARRTFDAKVKYSQSSNTTKVVNDLKKLGIDNLFQNEIKNLSTELDPIIGILVTRLRLSSGAEERVGVFSAGQISVENSADEDIVYKFEVCLKGPTDIIEEIGASSNFFTLGGHKDSLSPLLGSRVLTAGNIIKRANFTQKFFSKSMISVGALKYGNTQPTRSAGIESGKTNIFQIQAFENEKKVPKITTYKITKRSDGIIISWSGEDLDDVEKFEISVNDLIYPCIASIYQTNYFATIPGNVQGVPKLRAVLVTGESTTKEFLK